jgi:ferredoxin hydrogenase large subunit
LFAEHKEGNRVILHNISSCARCGNCWRICPEDAIEFKYLLRGEWDEVTRLKIVTCSICGEPIFTSNHEKMLREKHDQELETLCSNHRTSIRANAWLRTERKEIKRGDGRSER